MLSSFIPEFKGARAADQSSRNIKPRPEFKGSQAVVHSSKSVITSCSSDLKVPKREIFDCSDFPDFYTIKSLRVGDFGVKIKKNLKLFRGSFRGAKFLTCMLSLFLSRFFF